MRAGAEQMEADGSDVPEWVKSWIDAGRESFYERQGGQIRYAHDAYADLAEPGQLSLAARTVRSNAGAILIGIGEDVACLEFHSPNNATGADILTIGDRAP